VGLRSRGAARREYLGTDPIAFSLSQNPAAPTAAKDPAMGSSSYMQKRSQPKHAKPSLLSDFPQIAGK
jgi:hypothetical protein